ncbi:MAG: biopolymer transporter ExbD [Flavobacteriales bacterium]|nr:biopolymer transporter ExbD [Flavobacteriales bacterium]
MARKKRGVPEINAGSMADIAFLLLIFFLVTTRMDVDTGIIRELPPMPDENTPPPFDQANKRNLFIVLVNAYDQLLVNEEPTDIDNLKEKAKQFIDNNGDGSCTYCQGARNPKKSDNPSKAIVSLQNDRGTSYEMYITVQDQLAQAYTELRDRASMEKFGAVYGDLNDVQQDEINDMYPKLISEAEPKDVGES